MPLFLKYPHKYRSINELRKRWDEYRKYLKSVRSKLPKGVFEFAIADWHYSGKHHRSLHDSWLEELSIREKTKGRHKDRKLEIVIRLLGPFHDGHTTLTYVNVYSYKVHLPSPTNVRGQVHGDWSYDEIRLSSAGRVIHDIVFLDRAKMCIECETIKYSSDIPDVES